LESDQLKDLKESLKGLELILQYRHKTFQTDLAKKLVELEELRKNVDDDSLRTLPDCLLLDSSKGKGKVFDPNKMSELIASFSETCPSLGLAVAGGLTPDNVASVMSVLNKKQLQKLELFEVDPVRRRPFSVDVESGVRSQHGIDEEKVRTYLTNLAGGYCLSTVLRQD
jgi:phosphoribosylanthranilate isomerase